MMNNKAQSQETFAQPCAKNEHLAELGTFAQPSAKNEHLAELGLQAREYLPYPSTGISMAYDASALTNVANYSQYVGQTPFAEKKFEDSPLNRVLQQGALGNDWALPSNNTVPDNTVRFDYQNNTIADKVKLYTGYSTWDTTKALYDISLTQTGSSYYSNNQLYKTIIKNENWKTTDGKNNTTEEYRNKTGILILTRTYSDYKDSSGTLVTPQVAHDTYYVFDQFNNLIYTIPPLVTNIATQMDGLCYQYKYDYRNRQVEKKLPGKQWEYIVYDKLNRVVATGPALAPFTDLQTIPPAIPVVGWLITKYDLYNRPIYSGWQQVSSISTNSRKLLQNAQNILTTSLNETKQTSGTIDGIAAYYSNNVAPTSFKLLSVNYYDNYTYPNVATIPTTVEAQPILTTSQVKTLPTGSWNRTLTTTTSLTGETTSVFYDSKGRVVETYLKNYLGGYTKTDVNLDFGGVQQYTITYHKRLATDTEIKVTDNFTYTLQGRLLTHTHQVGSGTIQLLSKNDYNEIGQLITKRVGGTNVTGATSLQKVDYTYNIRGWLTDINDVNDLKIGTENDLFAFKLSYNTVTNAPNSNNVPLYNGNISDAYWRTKSDNIKRKYSYEYDSLNRLKNAVYQKPDDATQLTNSYNESVNYDKSGNIISLQRNGGFDDAVLTFQIDNLNYSYTNINAPNQLMKVTDLTNDPSGFNDDSNGSNDISDDYGYDANGNLIRGENKGILNGTSNAIIYNHLNLPTKIVFGTTGTIEYLYNANGEKLLKKVTQGSTITTTDYLDGFQYSNNVLLFFPTSEGYVSNTVINSVNNYNYVYNYKDHLGNSRLSYSKDITTGTLKILEENDYYPFGMKHTNYNVNMSYYYDPILHHVNHPMVDGGPAPVIASGVSSPFNYKFGGKEYQGELGLNNYDFGARNYDPAIGRWMNIDPLAENSLDVSPYAYGLNNPIYFIDSDGNIPTPYEAALMAQNVYNHNTKLSGGWHESSNWGSNRDDKDGFKGAMYDRTVNGKTEYAYVFAGTDSGRDGLKDWFNNLTQVIGLSSQYYKTVKLAQQISKYCHGDNSELTFVGHSLGGGLSNLASHVTGRSSIAFNPAWLSIETRILNVYDVVPLDPGNTRRDFVHSRDPLTAIQDVVGLKAGLIESGDRYEVKGDFLDINPLKNHSIEEMIRLMEENGGCGNRSDGKDSAVNSKKEREKPYLREFLDTRLMKDNGINGPED